MTNTQTTMYVLCLQGTGDDEYAYETAGVFTTHAAAVAKVAAINAEYEDEDFALEYKIDEWQLNTQLLLTKHFTYQHMYASMHYKLKQQLGAQYGNVQFN